MICAVYDCEKPKEHRAWCGMHYARWYSTGSPFIVRVGGPKRRDPSERFWALIDKTADCWNWMGAPNNRDEGTRYGRFTISYKPHRRMLAHRFAYEELVGPIPDGMELDHLCRNTACVRPDHLEPVTAHENRRREWIARKAS